MRSHAALPVCLVLIAGYLLAADQPAGGHPAVNAKAPNAKPPARAGKAAPAPNQSEQLEKLLSMKPEDRDLFLQNLPPKRRQNLEKRLAEIEAMPPARKERVLTRLQMLNRLPPEKQQEVRAALKQLQTLPPDRKAAIGKEMRQMAPLSPEQRQERMNSEDFRNRYSPAELEMMGNLAEVVP
jgi:hypothetical protein